MTPECMLYKHEQMSLYSQKSGLSWALVVQAFDPTQEAEEGESLS